MPFARSFPSLRILGACWFLLSAALSAHPLDATLASIQQGGPNAGTLLEKFFFEAYPRLIVFTNSRNGSWGRQCEAEEVVQETFLEYTSLPQAQKPTGFDWFLRASDRIAGRFSYAKIKTAGLAEFHAVPARPPVETSSEPSATQTAFRQALIQAPYTERAVLVLLSQGDSLVRIREKLHLSEKGLHKILNAARARLKAIVESDVLTGLTWEEREARLLSLPSERRDVVERYREGMKLPAIAMFLGVSRSEAQSRLREGLAQLSVDSAVRDVTPGVSRDYDREATMPLHNFVDLDAEEKRMLPIVLARLSNHELQAIQLHQEQRSRSEIKDDLQIPPQTHLYRVRRALKKVAEGLGRSVGDLHLNPPPGNVRRANALLKHFAGSFPEDKGEMLRNLIARSTAKQMITLELLAKHLNYAAVERATGISASRIKGHFHFTIGLLERQLGEPEGTLRLRNLSAEAAYAEPIFAGLSDAQNQVVQEALGQFRRRAQGPAMLQVVELFRQGLTPKEVADRLGNRPTTNRLRVVRVKKFVAQKLSISEGQLSLVVRDRELPTPDTDLLNPVFVGLTEAQSLVVAQTLMQIRGEFHGPAALETIALFCRGLTAQEVARATGVREGSIRKRLAGVKARAAAALNISADDLEWLVLPRSPAVLSEIITGIPPDLAPRLNAITSFTDKQRAVLSHLQAGGAIHKTPNFSRWGARDTCAKALELIERELQLPTGSLKAKRPQKAHANSAQE